MQKIPLFFFHDPKNPGVFRRTKKITLGQNQGWRSGPKSGGGRMLGVGMNGGGGLGVFDKEYQSVPVNCTADRLSAFCASRAKMSAIRTRHDKTMLLVAKGDNGYFRTLRAITYKKILNKSNAILAACLHLLATFGLECWVFACKKKYHLQKSGGGTAPPFSKVGGKHPPAPPRPPPMKILDPNKITQTSLSLKCASGAPGKVSKNLLSSGQFCASNGEQEQSLTSTGKPWC